MGGGGKVDGAFLQSVGRPEMMPAQAKSKREGKRLTKCGPDGDTSKALQGPTQKSSRGGGGRKEKRQPLEQNARPLDGLGGDHVKGGGFLERRGPQDPTNPTRKRVWLRGLDWGGVGATKGQQGQVWSHPTRKTKEGRWGLLKSQTSQRAGE